MYGELEAMNISGTDDANEQFLVKRSELADIVYFMEETNHSTCLKAFNEFFGNVDLETLYETSLFSITVIDSRTNGYVGLFIFNDSPFTSMKKEGFPAYPENFSPGIWEEWFEAYYDSQKIDGKNSRWLIYFILNEAYLTNEEMQKKIFHKVHLSLYTTANPVDAVFTILNKNIYYELSNLIGTPDNLSNSEMINITPFLAFKIMTSYMYDPLQEISNNSFPENNYVIFLNKRITVFPLIEIRSGTQEDHDDLENIFKDQTPSEVTNMYEDFFIAKMIADQDKDNKVLVGQVNDKAIGMIAVSTDVNANLLVKSFELENFDNLLKQDYMKAVRLKRKQITSAKEKAIDEERKDLMKRYKQEIMSCDRISQRIYLQEYIKTCEKDIEDIEEVEKTASNKEDLTIQVAHDLIKKILEKFQIKYPNFDQFDKKIKIDDGACLLTDEFNFFIETLEFFGLPKGYMQGNGHWADWLQKEAEKRAQKELFRKKLGQDAKKRTNRNTKKENEEPQKPTYFDFSPLAKAMRLFKDASLKVRSMLRKIVNENKNLIASFFVTEEGEPSETQCFDIMSLKKKLMQAKIVFPSEYSDMIGSIFLCFGNLPYKKRTIMRVPEEETVVVDKKDVKKKVKKDGKKKEVKEEEEKKEVKPVEVTLYEVSLSDFLRSVETSFNYDKLLHELKSISEEEFRQEYDSFIYQQEEKEKKKLQKEKSDYDLLKQDLYKKNLEESEEMLAKYSSYLENYDNETDIPPSPSEVLNCFCVKLFFIEQAFESRSSDFLMQAFDCFPDKDYLVITQPHSFSENSLLETFIRVDKKLDSLFSDVLYIIHRESLMISLLNVKHATKQDLINSAYLFENSEEADIYYKIANEAISSKNSKFVCVTAKIQENNIGLFLISKEVNINYYDSHFNIRDFSNLDKISKYYHGRIVFYLVHKNFQQYTKLIIKEISRLLNKISLYYELAPDVKQCPRFIKDLLILKNRKFPFYVQHQGNFHKDFYEDEKIKSRTDGEERDEFDKMESDFCLIMITKKMFADSRLANNNRIVIVGASDTGISFIESLLSIRYLDFSHIYLVAPGGLLHHHIEDEIQNLKISMNNYQISELKKLLLEHRIKIIDSKVIDIKPTSKYIQLQDNSILYYDYLILTLGLQDKLWTDLKNITTKQLDEKFNELKENQVILNPKDLNNVINNLNNSLKVLKDEMSQTLITIDDPYIYARLSPTERKMVQLRKNPKNEIILYGRSLNLICFIQGLLKRNIPANKIKLIIPNMYAHAINKDDKMSYKKDQNLLEEIHFTNSNHLEGTPEIEDYMIKNLIQLGVRIYHNYNFTGVNLNEANDSIVSYRFTEEGSEKTEDLTAFMIVTGGLIDVDHIVFKFIHENRLVYNGRAIIDKNFMTADSCIFAAGRLCEFSQRYFYTERGKLLRLESYNSREVGYTLAKSFLQIIDSQLNLDNSTMNENKLPTFYLPLPLGCYLPKDLLFYKVRAVKETNPKVLEKGVNRQPLVYNNLKYDGTGCFLKLTFNTFGIIESITYLGDLKVNYHSVVSLVGLHENYLNELLSRFDINLIDNIPEFLSENWAMALYHDSFSKLVIKLKNIINDKEEIQDIQNIISHVINNNLSLDRATLKNLLSNISENTQKKIEYEILNFLLENRNHLPFYHIPQIKE